MMVGGAKIIEDEGTRIGTAIIASHDCIYNEP